jgi:alpha 1,3-mannosyltransferase
LLKDVIADSALQFHPNAKNVKDMDLGHIARHTAAMNDLLNVHAHTPATTFERTSIRQTIYTIQEALYPWITKPKDSENSTYSSIFDIMDSYTEEAGIVICVGRVGFRWAVHQIVTLRAVLGCSLPIEVFYGGDDDLPEPYRTFIETLENAFPTFGSISTVDIKQKFPDPDGVLGLPGGWAMRPFAILASSFKTVILTDADVVFLQDPKILLQEPALANYGSVFWLDRLLYPAPAETYQWADELLETAKAQNLDQVHDSGWFRHQTFFEMERFAYHG